MFPAMCIDVEKEKKAAAAAASKDNASETTQNETT